MKNKLLWGLLWTFIAGLFYWSGVKNLDPDFGWHIKTGQIMLSQGIPRTDPFSYTMPTFPWVDHGRLSDVAIAWLYPKVGKMGLAVVLALAATATIIIVIPVNLRNMALVPLLLGIGVFVVRFGVRPQVEDWLFTAVCLRLSSDENLWRKWRWIMPAFFIIWSNFHGGWLVGLLIIAIKVAGGWWGTRKLNLKDMVVLVLSILFTAINPYGFRLWGEIWLTVSDTNLRWGIVEWQPFFMKSEMGYWLLTVLFWALFKKYGKFLEGWRVILTGGLLLGGITSLRNIPFYVLAVMPLTAELMERMRDTIEGNSETLSRAKKFYIILVVVAGLMFAIEAGVQTWKTAKGGGMIFPETAIEYLMKNPIKGRLFTDYGWGGYVIWKLPGVRQFIDGRMPSWRRVPPAGESTWAFRDYQKIINKRDYEELFAKYGIKTILWPKRDILQDTQIVPANILKKWADKLRINIGSDKPWKSFVEEITEKGWKKVYEDDEAVIYTKQK